MKQQLAIIRGCVETPEDNGKLVELIAFIKGGVFWMGPDGVRWATYGIDCFAVESLGTAFFAGHAEKWSQWTLVDKRRIFPINDNPGNEQFVVEARKSLPRPATAKGDTIDARGEVHS